MTLKGVIALILFYFTEFDSFAGLVVEDRPILSAEYRLPLFAIYTYPVAVKMEKKRIRKK